ncbi:MAG: glycosyltransferase family 2 protein [Chlorobi bacterium]|nr:glycosyltransferase family 2 protein [Chlorobiota bacterium]
MKLSAVIITYNEEKNIERCLKSLKDVADEIVVLDSFSADKTEEICKKYDVKFFRHKFDGYTEQKNKAVDLAENDFVISLDADEALSEELKNSIKKLKENPGYDAYKFNRLNIYCGKSVKHTSWYPDRKIRLWNKNKGKWEGDKIHETVKVKQAAKTGFLKGDLLHYSYNSIEEHIAQTNKFTTISAKELFEQGKKSSISIIIIKTIGSFAKEFLFKFAFLDGFYGIVVGGINTFSVFLKYSKLKALIDKSGK